MLPSLGSHGKEWLSLNSCKTLPDNSIHPATCWCPADPQPCLHGEIQMPGATSGLRDQNLQGWSQKSVFVKYLSKNS